MRIVSKQRAVARVLNVQEQLVGLDQRRVTQLPGEVDAALNGAVLRNVPKRSCFAANPITAAVLGDAVAPTEAELNDKIHGTVGQTEPHQTCSCRHDHVIVVHQRCSGDAPPPNLRRDRPENRPVFGMQGGKFTVGPPHEKKRRPRAARPTPGGGQAQRAHVVLGGGARSIPDRLPVQRERMDLWTILPGP